jgi:mRNA-degrading endonuclease RelE of RelBE toxin-antitoxin system
MKRRVVYLRRAADVIKKLDKKTAARIMDKIDYLAGLGGPPGVLLTKVPKKLKGLRKYRVGDYRVLFWTDEEQLTVYSIGHRSEIYKALRQR